MDGRRLAGDCRQLGTRLLDRNLWNGAANRLLKLFRQPLEPQQVGHSSTNRSRSMNIAGVVLAAFIVAVALGTLVFYMAV